MNAKIKKIQNKSIKLKQKIIYKNSVHQKIVNRFVGIKKKLKEICKLLL